MCLPVVAALHICQGSYNTLTLPGFLLPSLWFDGLGLTAVFDGLGLTVVDFKTLFIFVVFKVFVGSKMCLLLACSF